MPNFHKEILISHDFRTLKKKCLVQSRSYINERKNKDKQAAYRGCRDSRNRISSVISRDLVTENQRPVLLSLVFYKHIPLKYNFNTF